VAISRPSDPFAGSLGLVAGRSIVLTSYVTLGLFVVTIVPAAAGLSAFDGLSTFVALGLFLVSLPIWCYAFGLGLVRSSRGDDVNVSNLFFLTGSAPDAVRRPLIAVAAVSTVIAFATAWANAFAVLEPMFPLALLPLWGARYGVFPARPAPAVSR
jgi:hypothetical protein